MWPFSVRPKESPPEKNGAGDQPLKKNLFIRILFFAWSMIFGTVCFFVRLVKRFLIGFALGVISLGAVFIFAEEIVGSVDSLKPQLYDKHLGIDRSSIERLRDPAFFSEQSDFVSEDQKTIACISSPERRVLITDPADIPKLFKDAIVASEDKRFFEHEGVDKLGIVRAFWNRYILGTSMSGASTPTMQIAKNLRGGTGRESTHKEKIGDIVMALRLEQEFSKGQLLGKYVNMPFLGRSAYGIESASRAYFGKPAKDLKLHQVAFIVALINKPGLPDRAFTNDRSATTPEDIRNANWQQVLKGTRRVLELMDDAGMVAPDEYTRAADAIDSSLRADVLPRGNNCGANSYFTEYVRQDLIKRSFRVDKGGLSVSITRDDGLQNALEEAVKMTVKTYLARHVNDLDNGDLRAGAVAIEFTGDVLAEVGNIDFRKFKYDVMAQGYRSPGSTYKIITFGGLVEQLVTETIAEGGETLLLEDVVSRVSKKCSVLDAPIAVSLGRGRGKKWIQNFHSNSQPLYRGQIPCVLAVAESRNAAAMRAGQRAGMKNVLNLMHGLGIPKDARYPCLPYPTTAIGACDVNPLSMSTTAAFLNGGYKVTPRFVNDVCKSGKSLIYKDELGGQRDCDPKGSHREPLVRVMHPATSVVVTELFKGPIDISTGSAHSLRTGVIPGMDPLSGENWKLKPEERKKRMLSFPLELSGEIAGKTGTATNADGRTSDVWLTLFVPGPDASPEKGIMLIFWMGKDSKDHALGERGTTGGKGYAESGGRNWTHSAATVLAFLKKERGYLKPGFKFQPMMKDEVLSGFEARRNTAPVQEIIPGPDSPVIIDPFDPKTPPELLKDLPPAETETREEPSTAPQDDGKQTPDTITD